MPNTKRARAANARGRTKAQEWREAKARAAKLRDWSEAKNEAEEAAWWDANSERLMLAAAKRGALRMGTVEQLVADMKKAKRDATRLLSLRIPVADIELAKAQAEEKGMGYQTYIKSRLHESLQQAARVSARQQNPGRRALRRTKS